jgi:hypothetical protein
VVGRVGFEPTTNGLKGRCSTTELPTHWPKAASGIEPGQALVEFTVPDRQWNGMIAIRFKPRATSGKIFGHGTPPSLDRAGAVPIGITVGPATTVVTQHELPSSEVGRWEWLESTSISDFCPERAVFLGLRPGPKMTNLTPRRIAEGL